MTLKKSRIIAAAFAAVGLVAFAMANGMGAEANFPELRLTSSDGVDVRAIRWGVLSKIFPLCSKKIERFFRFPSLRRETVFCLKSYIQSYIQKHAREAV